jgi:hypothetical protein
MKPYRDFQPTGFDPKGLCADHYDIGDFLVLLSHNRDSGILDESNWAIALDMLGGESETVQVYRFTHSSCGWFELLLIDPTDADKRTIAEDIESELENYPILDDFDLSAREVEYATEMGWTSAPDYGWLDSDGNRQEVPY